MAGESRLVQHKHANETTYVYEIVSNVWDEESSEPRGETLSILRSRHCLDKPLI